MTISLVLLKLTTISLLSAQERSCWKKYCMLEGTTALGREDSDIHFTSHFTLYSHNLHFNTYYCNCMSSSSSSSSFICEREYNKPT